MTLDPSNPQHLWIVDSGTDKVYQYDNAVSRTSGSQSASTTFALAAATPTRKASPTRRPPGMRLGADADGCGWANQRQLCRLTGSGD